MAEGSQHTVQIMETQTRFDLDAAIAEWQQELAGQPELTSVVRRELETHLRDTVAELQAHGLNSEESFWLARRRVGQPGLLSEEFAKADPAKVGRERVFWVVLALLTISLWQSTLGSSLVFLNNAQSPGVAVMIFRIIILAANWLPILIGIVLVAKGRLNFATNQRLRFFNSRVRIGVAGFSWIGILAVLRCIAMWWILRLADHHIDIWINLLITAITGIIWPAMLLGLLLWLMPRRLPPALKSI